MAAAGITPKTATMILSESPLLKQQMPFVIEDENTECPVQKPLLMSFQLLHAAYRFIIRINKNYPVHVFCFKGAEVRTAKYWKKKMSIGIARQHFLQ